MRSRKRRRWGGGKNEKRGSWKRDRGGDSSGGGGSREMKSATVVGSCDKEVVKIRPLLPPPLLQQTGRSQHKLCGCDAPYMHQCHSSTALTMNQVGDELNVATLITTSTGPTYTNISTTTAHLHSRSSSNLTTTTSTFSTSVTVKPQKRLDEEVSGPQRVHDHLPV